ncbi:MAG: glycosyltransferase family 39 protein [Rhodobacteraceae bacterium]|nr:glycosyltransferase family 39 protein [Paracoccaceae bacterium]
MSAAIQIWLPIFGDEPYFTSWGLTPSWGYYDHPGLIGWISTAIIKLENLLGIVNHGILHRVFMLLLGVVTVVLLAKYLGRHMDGQPMVLLLGFAALPTSMVVFNVFFNDTVLAVTLLVFLIFTEKAYSDSRWNWAAIILAGGAFGASLLLKYSAGIFYLAVVGYLLVSPQGRQFLFGKFAVISVIAGVIFLQNVYWNYQNCSVNFAFNFAFRRIEADMIGLVHV